MCSTEARPPRVAAGGVPRYRGAVSIDVLVVLCGGAGERLWPASHPARPKPLIPFGGTTLLAATLERFAPLTSEILLVCGPEHAAAMRAAAPRARVLVEPERRGTGPAITAAAAVVRAGHGPGALVLATPADHVVADAPALQRAIVRGASHARRGDLVTFGVVPDHPHTGYGWIGRGEPLGADAHRIARFTEKPDPATAARLLAEGYLWNSGLFSFGAASLAAEVARIDPALAAAAERAAAQLVHRDGCSWLDPDAFRAAPRGSFDVQVAERTDRGVVLAVDCGWSDVGSWEAVARHFPSGPDGSFVWAEGVEVRADGLVGVGIAASPLGVRVFSLSPRMVSPPKGGPSGA